ncbi:hypothetical protein E4U57_007965 [Claviceps arundinis]|uniref:Methyltransferase n=1 Tax=Claviceps arundinis TaxID=1623583 RepID=A0A9P7MM07_9HYPO|nr:hypothetical protein E4U56_005175 [Claviceps arundinis]KAG5967887.1 hypothetical protein E4U57_007965 [Claviceps arundinis]
MASGSSSQSVDRDAATSPEFGTNDEFGSREGENSTESLASTAVHAIGSHSIEVGNRTDDGFDFSSESESDNATASLASSILSAQTYERGRRYADFGDGRYPIPNDEMEQNREDMKHAMVMMLTENRLFLSPIGDHPQKILDIGTGTGIWAIQVGDRYPSAKVRGIDIAPIQPEWVPPNVSFLVDDCELDWIERDVDLAHFRFMVVVLKNTSRIFGHAYESLRPGGWIELQELLPIPLCDDGTMPDDDPVKYLCELVEKAYEKFGMRAKLPVELESYLQEAGFKNIHCQVMKVPIGPWAKDRNMRILGLYQKTVFVEGLPVLAGRPFQALGMSDAEAEVTIALARKSLEDPDAHRYFTYYFWYAQKPESPRAEPDV